MWSSTTTLYQLLPLLVVITTQNVVFDNGKKLLFQALPVVITTQNVVFDNKDGSEYIIRDVVITTQNVVFDNKIFILALTK